MPRIKQAKIDFFNSPEKDGNEQGKSQGALVEEQREREGEGERERAGNAVVVRQRPDTRARTRTQMGELKLDLEKLGGE